MHRATRRSVASGTAGAAAGVALAVGILPALATTVKPTPLGSALLTVLLAVVSIGVQRWNDRRKQRSELADLLRTWPPQELAIAEPGSLGAYPGHGDDGRPEPYRTRPRDEDAILRRALAGSSIVVVHGEPGVGKSRGAAEAARRVLGGVPVLVPVNADALTMLADDIICCPRRLGRRVCVWLDGLDRFIDSLDAGVLSRLASMSQQVTLVATIRTEEWDRLLDGSGQASETARTLVRDGTVVKIGARAAAGAASDAEEAVDGETASEPEGVDPVWADAWLVTYGVALLATIVAAAIAAITGFGGGLVQPAPLEDQMSAITNDMVSDAGAGGGHVVLNERIRFHDGEADSWVIAVEDTPSHDTFTGAVANCSSDSPTQCVHPPPRSDELRIYDVRGGQLQLALDFRPSDTGSHAAELDTIAGTGSVGGEYDNDNAPELIVSYMWPDRAYTLLPFGVYWRNGGYHLAALTPARPPLALQGHDPRMALFTLQAYDRLTSLSNAVDDPRFRALRLTGYRVQTAALVQQPVARLLTGYYAAYAPDDTKPRTIALFATQVRPDLGTVLCTPTYYACRAPLRQEEVVVPPDRALDSGLLEAWSIVGSKWRQHVRVLEANTSS